MAIHEQCQITGEMSLLSSSINEGVSALGFVGGVMEDDYRYGYPSINDNIDGTHKNPDNDVALHGSQLARETFLQNIETTSEAYSYLYSSGSNGTGNNNFRAPMGVANDGTYLYIADTYNNRIIKRLCSDLSYVSKTTSSLNKPGDVTTDGTYIYVDDTFNSKIVKFSCQTLNYVSDIGTAGSGNDQFSGSFGITTDGTYLYVADTINSRVVKRQNSDLSYVSETAMGSNPFSLTTDGTTLYTLCVGGTIEKNLCSNLSSVSSITSSSFSNTLYISLFGGYLYLSKLSHTLLKVDPSDFSVKQLTNYPQLEPMGISFLENKMFFSSIANHKIAALTNLVEATTLSFQPGELQTLCMGVGGETDKFSKFVFDSYRTDLTSSFSQLNNSNYFSNNYASQGIPNTNIFKRYKMCAVEDWSIYSESISRGIKYGGCNSVNNSDVDKCWIIASGTILSSSGENISAPVKTWYINGDLAAEASITQDNSLKISVNTVGIDDYMMGNCLTGSSFIYDHVDPLNYTGSANNPILSYMDMNTEGGKDVLYAFDTDASPHVILLKSTNGNPYTVDSFITGSYSSGFGFDVARGIACDGNNIFVAYTDDNMSPATSMLEKMSSGFASVALQPHWNGVSDFGYISDICIDSDYVYTTETTRVCKFNKSDLSPVASSGSSGTGINNFTTITGICTDGTYIYIADNGNSRIVKRLCSNLSYHSHVTLPLNPNQSISGIKTDGTYLYLIGGTHTNDEKGITKILCSDLSIVDETSRYLHGTLPFVDKHNVGVSAQDYDMINSLAISKTNNYFYLSFGSRLQSCKILRRRCSDLTDDEIPQRYQTYCVYNATSSYTGSPFIDDGWGTYNIKLGYYGEFAELTSSTHPEHLCKMSICSQNVDVVSSSVYPYTLEKYSDRYKNKCSFLLVPSFNATEDVLLGDNFFRGVFPTTNWHDIISSPYYTDFGTGSNFSGLYDKMFIYTEHTQDPLTTIVSQTDGFVISAIALNNGYEPKILPLVKYNSSGAIQVCVAKEEKEVTELDYTETPIVGTDDFMNVIIKYKNLSYSFVDIVNLDGTVKTFDKSVNQKTFIVVDLISLKFKALNNDVFLGEYPLPFVENCYDLDCGYIKDTKFDEPGKDYVIQFFNLPKSKAISFVGPAIGTDPFVAHKNKADFYVKNLSFSVASTEKEDIRLQGCYQLMAYNTGTGFITTYPWEWDRKITLKPLDQRKSVYKKTGSTRGLESKTYGYSSMQLDASGNKIYNKFNPDAAVEFCLASGEMYDYETEQHYNFFKSKMNGWYSCVYPVYTSFGW